MGVPQARSGPGSRQRRCSGTGVFIPLLRSCEEPSQGTSEACNPRNYQHSYHAQSRGSCSSMSSSQYSSSPSGSSLVSHSSSGSGSPPSSPSTVASFRSGYPSSAASGHNDYRSAQQSSWEGGSAASNSECFRFMPCSSGLQDCSTPEWPRSPIGPLASSVPLQPSFMRHASLDLQVEGRSDSFCSSKLGPYAAACPAPYGTRYSPAACQQQRHRRASYCTSNARMHAAQQSMLYQPTPMGLTSAASAPAAPRQCQAAMLPPANTCGIQQGLSQQSLAAAAAAGACTYTEEVLDEQIQAMLLEVMHLGDLVAAATGSAAHMEGCGPRPSSQQALPPATETALNLQQQQQMAMMAQGVARETLYTASSAAGSSCMMQGSQGPLLAAAPQAPAYSQLGGVNDDAAGLGCYMERHHMQKLMHQQCISAAAATAFYGGGSPKAAAAAVTRGLVSDLGCMCLSDDAQAKLQELMAAQALQLEIQNELLAMLAA